MFSFTNYYQKEKKQTTALINDVDDTIIVKTKYMDTLVINDEYCPYICKLTELIGKSNKENEVEVVLKNTKKISVNPDYFKNSISIDWEEILHNEIDEYKEVPSSVLAEKCGLISDDFGRFSMMFKNESTPTVVAKYVALSILRWKGKGKILTKEDVKEITEKDGDVQIEKMMGYDKCGSVFIKLINISLGFKIKKNFYLF